MQKHSQHHLSHFRRLFRVPVMFSASVLRIALVLIAICSCVSQVQASLGDRLPEFRECVEVLILPHLSV